MAAGVAVTVRAGERRSKRRRRLIGLQFTLRSYTLRRKTIEREQRSCAESLLLLGPFLQSVNQSILLTKG